MTLLVYEDSWQGFLSAIFEAFALKTPVTLQNTARFDGGTLFGLVRVPEDETKTHRVEAGMRRLSRDLPGSVFTIWLTEFDGIENQILETLKLGFKTGADPLPSRQHDFVKTVMDAYRHITFEVQRFCGYVRFIHAGGDLYVADITPDCNILPLIADHFHNRFRNQRFMIRDTSRRTAIISDASKWELARLPEGEIPPLPDGGLFEKMWKSYFESIANQARVNKKLQQQFVPLKYRKNLTEFGG